MLRASGFSGEFSGIHKDQTIVIISNYKDILSVCLSVCCPYCYSMYHSSWLVCLSFWQDKEELESHPRGEKRCRRQEKNRVAARKTRKKQTERADELHEVHRWPFISPLDFLSCYRFHYYRSKLMLSMIIIIHFISEASTTLQSALHKTVGKKGT